MKRLLRWARRLTPHRPLAVFTLTTGHSGSLYLSRLFRGVSGAYSQWNSPLASADGRGCDTTSSVSVARCNFSRAALQPIDQLLTALEMQVRLLVEGSTSITPTARPGERELNPTATQFSSRDVILQGGEAVERPAARLTYLDAHSTFLDAYSLPVVSILHGFDIRLVFLLRHPPRVMRSMLCTMLDRTEGWSPQSSLGEELKAHLDDAELSLDGSWDDLDEIAAFIVDHKRRVHAFATHWLKLGVLSAVVYSALEQLQNEEHVRGLFELLGINSTLVTSLLLSEIGTKRHSHLNRTCKLPSDSLVYYEARFMEFVDKMGSLIPESNTAGR